MSSLVRFRLSTSHASVCLSVCLSVRPSVLSIYVLLSVLFIGIPRPVPEYETEIKAILSVPSVAAVMPAYEHETEWTKQVASDCIWSDPASEIMERCLDETGFGDSPRGGGAVW